MPKTFLGLRKGPWFKDGVRFTCQPGCTRCCGGEPGYVWLTGEELKAIAAFMHCAVEEFEKKYVRRLAWGQKSLRERANGDCVLLDAEGKGCSIYPVRPKQCRDYPFWPEVLKSRRSWEREKKRCPGIGEGELHEAPKLAELLKRQPSEPA